MILTELNLALLSQKLRSRAVNITGLVIVLMGLIAMSYPRDAPEAATWSFALKNLGDSVLPYNGDKYKPWVSLGSLILVLGVTLSPSAQSMLSLPIMVWLGKISFPLYLLHGTFVRSLFAWVLFWGQELRPWRHDPQVLKYPLPSASWITFSVICFFIPLLLCCHLWVKHVEPLCDRATLWMEEIMLCKENPESQLRQGSFKTSSWFERIRSTLSAIVWVIRHGGLPSTIQTTYPALDSLESGGLLQEMEERDDTSSWSLGIAEPIPYDDFEDVPTTRGELPLPEAFEYEKAEETGEGV